MKLRKGQVDYNFLGNTKIDGEWTPRQEGEALRKDILMLMRQKILKELIENRDSFVSGINCRMSGISR